MRIIYYLLTPKGVMVMMVQAIARFLMTKKSNYFAIEGKETVVSKKKPENLQFACCGGKDLKILLTLYFIR